MVTGRRGCLKCGRIEMQTTCSPWQKSWWWLWGYALPVDFDLPDEEFSAKYVVPVPATRYCHRNP